MRLLHAGTRTLHEFEGSIPEYAILSHTWGADEIKFDDILREPSRSQWSNKIDGCCGVALRHKVEYVWIDTCCINKSSSTELSEAINSMYNWYRGAKVCLVYLADVPSDEDPGDENSRFRSSRWFTRGWTLQEMLAPPLLIFYTGDWVLIGEVLRGPDCALDGFDIEEGEFGQDRRDGLSWLISGITQIPKIYVLGEPLANASVAQRMSWAARRETTRLEDQAYCLLGIFSINMPLLYGEGRRAFQRLQEEIMKEQHDHTLFTWAWPTDAFGGCLAQSPSNFSLCGRICPNESASFLVAPYSHEFGDNTTIPKRSFLVSRSRALALWVGWPSWKALKRAIARNIQRRWPAPTKTTHYVLTNEGLLIDLELLELPSGDFLARLNCTLQGLEDMCMAMPLFQVPGKDTFCRYPNTNPAELLAPCSAFGRTSPRSIYITKLNPNAERVSCGILLELGAFAEQGISLVDIHPPNWNLEDGTVDVLVGSGSKNYQRESYTIFIAGRDAKEQGFAMRLEYTCEPHRNHGSPAAYIPLSLRCSGSVLNEPYSLRRQLASGKLKWRANIQIGDQLYHLTLQDKNSPLWSLRLERGALRSYSGRPKAWVRD